MASMVMISCTKRLPDLEGGNEPVRLAVGLSQVSTGTKGDPEPEPTPNPDANHTNHRDFTGGTKASVRFYGEKAGPEAVWKNTTATIKSTKNFDEKHNDISVNPDVFWDDFGAADGANTAGRERGLDIYGVAVNGVETAPVIADDAWTSFAWNLPTDQRGGWSAKDLLTSNNITVANSNPYKFLERGDGKLMEFTHAMSKVTVNLTAGDGFPIVEGNHVFEREPQVTLLSFKYKGSVNIVEKVSTPNGEVANITPKTTSTGEGANTASFNALVYPGNVFDDATDIIKIDADGNIYYVSAANINSKMGVDKNFGDGKEYIFNITLKKTDIIVSATISDWTSITSDEIEPVINVDASPGTGGGGTLGDGFTSFSFYRSATACTAADINKGYSAGAARISGRVPAEAIAVKPVAPAVKWTFNTLDKSSIIKLFWPTHDTHYQFRGVWPETSTADDSAAPKVIETGEEALIRVFDTAYTKDSYPSDLLIGRPEFGFDSDGATPLDPECTNGDHEHKHLYSEGVCATTGIVTLNFRYMMSQVEVILSTTGDTAVDHVELGENTVVEIVNGYKDGYVGLGDRIVTVSGDTGSYTLDPVSTDGLDGDELAKAKLTRHSAIVPQALTFSTTGAESNLRFKITVTNSDSTTDIYFADIKPIKKNGSEDLVAPNGRWESGVHYVYNLKIKKTEISVTATVTDWVRVDAEDDIWF